jgi:hypothetical protein
MVRADEHLTLVDDGPDDRPMRGAIGAGGLDLDLVGPVDLLDLMLGEPHARSVAHLGARGRWEGGTAVARGRTRRPL